MAESRAALETELNDLRREVRQSALAALVEQVAHGEIELPTPRPIVNLHCHTSCSYNGYGYSPSYIVVLTDEAKAWILRDALPPNEIRIVFPETFKASYAALRDYVPVGTDLLLIAGRGMGLE